MTSTARYPLRKNQIAICTLAFLTLQYNIWCNAYVPPIVPPTTATAALTHTMVGAISGGMGAFAVYPFDFIKSQLQTEHGKLAYKDGFDCFHQHVSKSPLGFVDLYRGCHVNVLGVAPEKTIKLTVNDAARAAFLGVLRTASLPLSAEMFAGGLAGACQVLVTNPLEVVKVRMQTSSQSFGEVWRDVGNVAGLYRGCGACLARDVIFSAFLFPMYAHTKVEIPLLLPHLSTLWCGVLAGSIAAAPAAFIATPADFVKTRMQQANASSSLNDSSNLLTTRIESSNNDRSNAWDTACSILDAEGPMVFFSGWLERVVRSAPQFGVTLGMFDFLNAWMQAHGY